MTIRTISILALILVCLAMTPALAKDVSPPEPGLAVELSTDDVLLPLLPVTAIMGSNLQDPKTAEQSRGAYTVAMQMRAAQVQLAVGRQCPAGKEVIAALRGVS